MNYKKLILSLSIFSIIGILGLTSFFFINNTSSSSLSFLNQSANIGAESKEERVVNKKLTEIINTPPLITNEDTLKVEKFVKDIEEAIKEDKQEIKVDEISEEKVAEPQNKDVNLSTENDSKEVSSKESEVSLENQVSQEELKEKVIEENNDNLMEKNDKSKIIEEQIDSVDDKTDNEIINNQEIKESQEKILKPTTPIINNINVSTNSFSINFDESINAKNYICMYGIKNNLLNEEGTVINAIDGYQCFINNVEEGTLYYVKIIAKNQELESSSEVQEIKTLFTKPEQSNLISNVVNNNNIKVSYTVSKNAKRYSCLYKETSESKWNVSGNLVIDNDKLYCEVNNLKENTNYDIKMVSINGNEMTESKISTLKTSYIKPEIPVIQHIITSKKDIKIILNKSKNATSYICKYGLTNKSLNSFGRIIINDDSVECNIEDLSSNTSYYVQIFAYNHDIYDNSEIIEISTNELSELSEPILTTTKNNSNEIDATFNIYKGKPSQVTCKYGIDKNDLDKEGTIINKTDSLATCRLSDLDEGQSYFVKLIATNDDFTKESQISTVKTEFTKPTKSVLNSKKITENSFIAYFEQSKNANKYECYYGTNNSNINMSANVISENGLLKCEVNNLIEGTKYFVKVVSINGDKQISSDIYEIVTDYATPTKPNIINKYETANSIKVIYSLSKNATEYKGYIGTDKNNLAETPIKVTNNSVEIESFNLNSVTNYYFKLVSINKNMKEISSDISEIKTLDKLIQKPVLVNSTFTDSSINLEYNTEDDLDLYICYYGTNENSLENSVNAIKTKDNIRQCNIDNLNQNTKYYYKLAVIKNNKIIESDIENINTQYKTPNLPTLKSLDTTNNSLSITFNIDENIDNYVCKIGTDETNINTIISANKSGATVSCNTDNLLSKTNYYVTLTITNGDKTVVSFPITAATKYNIPTKPIWMSETKTDNSITSIYSLSDNATDYICYIGTDFNDIKKLGNAKVENNQLKCEFTGLEDGTQYLYKVEATNHNEIFTSSDIKLSKTEYSNPDTPIADNIITGTDSFKVTYPVSTNAKTYICKYGTDKNNLNNTGITSININNSIDCSANNLLDNTTYFVQLTSVNGNKQTKSQVLEIKTKEKAIETSQKDLEKPEYIGIRQKAMGELILDFTKVDAYKQYCYYGTSENNITNRVSTSPTEKGVKCTIPYDEYEDYYIISRAYLNDGVTYSESEVTKIESEAYIPEKPILDNTSKDFENIITTYKIGGYTQGHKCYIGTSQNNITTEGTSAERGYYQYCAFTNLNPDTTYYVKIDNIYGKNKSSDITTIKTDAINNSCNGDALEFGKDYTSKVNSKCGVSSNSIESQNALDVATDLATIDTLKVLKDYPQYNFKSFASIDPIYTANNNIGGYEVTVSLYSPGDMSATLGSYMLKNGLYRDWMLRMPYDR